MRAIEKVNRLEDHIGKLHLIDKKDEYAHKSSRYIIQNWGDVKDALDGLRTDFSFLEPRIKSIYEIDKDLENTRELPHLSEVRKDYLKSLLVELKEIVIVIKKTLETTMVKDQEDQVNFKLPDNVSFQTLSEISNCINEILNNSYIKQLNNGKAGCLTAVDSGSIWLLVVLSSAAVIAIERIVSIVMNIRREILETSLLEEVKKGEQFSNELKEHCLETIIILMNKHNKKLSEQDVIDQEQEADSLSLIEKVWCLSTTHDVQVLPFLKAQKNTNSLFSTKNEQDLIETKENDLSLRNLYKILPSLRCLEEK